MSVGPKLKNPVPNMCYYHHMIFIDVNKEHMACGNGNENL